MLTEGAGGKRGREGGGVGLSVLPTTILISPVASGPRGYSPDECIVSDRLRAYLRSLPTNLSGGNSGVFVPVLYLALVWIAVWKFRRRWQAGVILLIAPAPLLIATSMLSVISRSPEATQVSSNYFVQNLIGFGGVLHLVSGAYLLVMLLVGAIIAVAKPSGTRVPCNRCGYDLVGTHELTCPECGGRLSLCVQELRMQVYMADREAEAGSAVNPA